MTILAAIENDHFAAPTGQFDSTSQKPGRVDIAYLEGGHRWKTFCEDWPLNRLSDLPHIRHALKVAVKDALARVASTDMSHPEDLKEYYCLVSFNGLEEKSLALRDEGKQKNQLIFDVSISGGDIDEIIDKKPENSIPGGWYFDL